MLDPGLRVGQLADRLGVSTHLLRAWEQRYGLFDPMRSPGGYRLYGEADERRARAALRRQRSGTSTAEAARLALLEVPLVESDTEATGRDPVVSAILGAVDAFDQQGITDAFDDADSLPSGVFVDDVVLPVLRALSTYLADGPSTVAHALLGAEAVRAQLLRRTQELPVGDGPVVWLACPANEGHDLALLGFGLVLADRGYRVRFIGGGTPLTELHRAAVQRRPDAIVLALTRGGALRGQHKHLSQLARGVPVWLAGPSASPATARSTGARHMVHDVVTSAQTFTTEPARHASA